MDQTTFWSLIDRIDRGALNAGDEDAAVAPLIDELSRCPEQEMHEFEDILAQQLYDLDGHIYAEAADESGPSGDAFLYARCYVVGCGRDHYDAVKANPTLMPKSLDQWCESLLYVASRAWAAATGNNEEDWEHFTGVSYETGSNKAKWK
ncbi:MAG: DUF4240 domain-containing protein [Planctomycetes bacterium]|nr:DUF4240 domain-containing protein [Planctomycetota bacterium]